jgi:polyisoprenoid-binding protein YceI
MTNYTALAALLLLAACARGAEQPVSPAPAKPATAPVATPPAATSAGTRYVQAPAGSSLRFSFTQVGADSTGQFRKFSTALVYDEKNLAASSLQVQVDMASLDTQDSERDTTLAGAELFDIQKHPGATFVAKTLARTPAGFEAVGQLTIRGVSRNLRLPFTLKPAGQGLELTGQTSIKRLDFGVGQGEWKSTESVGDDVKISYKVALVKAPGTAQ